MFTFITDNIVGIVAILGGISTTCSAIAALTPTPKDDGWAAMLYKAVDWLALNVGKAKDK